MKLKLLFLLAVLAVNAVGQIPIPTPIVRTNLGYYFYVQGFNTNDCLPASVNCLTSVFTLPSNVVWTNSFPCQFSYDFEPDTNDNLQNYLCYYQRTNGPVRYINIGQATTNIVFSVYTPATKVISFACGGVVFDCETNPVGVKYFEVEQSSLAGWTNVITPTYAAIDISTNLIAWNFYENVFVSTPQITETNYVY